jgi:hypothetical protein
MESVSVDFVTYDKKDKYRDLGECYLCWQATREGLVETYPDIVGNKTPCVKWMLEEWSNTIEKDKNRACNPSVRSLEPLSM